ncbi:hypothetical protein DMENIID0001_020870 [Sergentomyia squamirostris]
MNSEQKEKKVRKFTHSCYFHKCNEILHLIVECHCSEADEVKKKEVLEEKPNGKETVSRRVSFNGLQDVSNTRKQRRMSKDLVSLNFPLMEKYLRDENSLHRGKLLQAIRWRMTVDPKGVGSKIAAEIVENDFLCLRKTDNKLLETLLWSSERKKTSQHLQNSTSRLLNALSGFPEGVDYLGRGVVIESLIFGEQFSLVSLHRQFVDSHTAGMLISTMTRISSRPEVAKMMITRGYVPWIIEYLEEIEYSGTDYQIRQSLSLLGSLFNLPEAINEEFLSRTAQFLALLARYINKNHSKQSQIIKIISTSLLKRPEIAEIAKSMNFEKILQEIPSIENAKDTPAKDIDPEIDIDDPVCELPGLEGEMFLEEHFTNEKSPIKLESAKTKEKSYIPIRVEEKPSKDLGKKEEVVKLTTKPSRRRTSQKDILSDSDPEISQALRAIFPGDV